MCRKFKFIQDIDNKTVADFTAYCMRLRKLYCIFTVISAFNLWGLYYSSHEDMFIISVVGFFFYVVVAGFYFCITDPPKVQAIFGTLIAVICLWLDEIFTAAYQLVVYPSWFIAFSLISISLQVCSAYILYRFWLLLRRGSDTVIVSDVENPAPMTRY